ncbi:MAG TPA: flagellar motor protein MotB [Woeseiaceae bacterium]|nr:flagellar motor protein MotB [Woeseiaceae bacterium]
MYAGHTEHGPPKSERTPLPPWVMTFADMMTLLMCFFVLLLAFSEMDVAKFKELSGSMKEAFGVQTEVDVRTIPKGTSIIAQEFSPGVPDPTAMNTVYQFTVDSNENTLDALAKREQDLKDTEDHAKRLREALKAEIEKGSVAIHTEDRKVIIHILENASFDSGYANMRPEFRPVLAKIGSLIDSNSGTVTVSGHTDNVPIANERFRSNWELSASRAVSVTHELLLEATLDVSRFVVTGHAATKPRAPNDSDENRAKNRRVDISIVRGNELDTHRSMSISNTLTSAAGNEEYHND